MLLGIAWARGGAACVRDDDDSLLFRPLIGRRGFEGRGPTHTYKAAPPDEILNTGIVCCVGGGVLRSGALGLEGEIWLTGSLIHASVARFMTVTVSVSNPSCTPRSPRSNNTTQHTLGITKTGRTGTSQTGRGVHGRSRSLAAWPADTIMMKVRLVRCSRARLPNELLRRPFASTLPSSTCIHTLFFAKRLPFPSHTHIN